MIQLKKQKKIIVRKINILKSKLKKYKNKNNKGGKKNKNNKKKIKKAKSKLKKAKSKLKKAKSKLKKNKKSTIKTECPPTLQPETASYKYIIVSNSGQYCNLGHELFFTRKILFTLLYYKLIKTNVTVITSYNDRKFLYNKYFNNIITFREFQSISTPFNDNSIIDLSPYLKTNYTKTIKELNNIGLDNPSLFENKIFNNVNTVEFNKYICNLNYCNTYKYNDIIDKKFFVIHIRPTSKKVNYCLEFIKYCDLNKNLKCVIFTTLKNVKYKYQTCDLQMYASLMMHDNCIGLLSEWSGGGQLAQFCAKKIIFYYENYPHSYHTSQVLNYEQQNNNNFTACWDHYNPIGSKRYFIDKKELEDMNKLALYLLN